MNSEDFAMARQPLLPVEASSADDTGLEQDFLAAETPVVDAFESMAADFNELRAADEHRSGWQRAREWAARNKGKLALGAAAVSATLTFTMNPLGEVTHEIVEAAPVIGVGIVASEAMFAGGIALMATSVGSKIGNPLKLKERLPEICAEANDSKLFKAGFWINTVGAVGSAAIIAGGVVAKLPPESYGVLGFAAADLAVTVAVRKAMLSGIRRNAEKDDAKSVDTTQNA